MLGNISKVRTTRFGPRPLCPQTLTFLLSQSLLHSSLQSHIGSDLPCQVSANLQLGCRERPPALSGGLAPAPWILASIPPTPYSKLSLLWRRGQ